MYKVSVIIPTYNSDKYIDRTINSVINQSIGFENIELILVDDNSSDNTKKIIKNYEKKYDNIKCFFYDDNSGTPSRSRNKGIELASSEFVMFLDNDDCYDEFICEKLYDAIIKYDVNIGVCRFYLLENSHKSINQDYGLSNKSDYILLNPRDNDKFFNEVCVWNKIYKTSFLKEFEIYYPLNMLAEDMCFCFKAYLNCDKVILLNNYCGYIYNVRNSEDNSSLSNVFSLDVLIKFLNGFKEACELGKNDKIYLKMLMEVQLVRLLAPFVKSDISYNDKLNFLEEIYILEEDLEDIHLKELWAEIINKNIKKRNFKRAIYISNLIKFIKQSKFITKLYRLIYLS